jgi:hypothetical protein
MEISQLNPFVQLIYTNKMGKSISWLIPQGEESCNLPPDFFWVLLQVPFSFVDLALYPFSAINHSHQYNYILSLESSPYDLFNILFVWSWGSLTELCIRQIEQNEKAIGIILHELIRKRR